MWVGRRHHKYCPQIHFPTSPAVLAVRKHKDSNEIEHLTLRTLIETRCKGLFRKFKHHRWLFNGHLQTIYGKIADLSKRDYVVQSHLCLTDGGTLGLDFTPLNTSHLRDDSPIVVVVPGLTGGPFESYIRAILSRACASVEDGGLGYRAVVVNHRGCAGVPVTSPAIHCPGNTDDFRQALYYISSKYSKARLLGLGFSSGANDLTRYLAEEGNRSRIHTACALACPWDFASNNVFLVESFLGRHLYAKALGGNLLKVLKRHSQILLSDAEPKIAEACVRALKLKRPTIDEFHDVFTRIAGRPTTYFPFETTQQYYQWGSSHQAVKDIKVPFLAINASDDPVVRHVPIHGGGNGLVVMALTSGGGHLGWFQSGHVFERWTTQPVLEWLKLGGEELVDDPDIKSKDLYVDHDGFFKENARPSLGCKPIEGGGVINGNNGEKGLLLGP